MDCLDPSENLGSQPQGRAEREAALGLTAPQLGEVLALQGHYHVVVVLVTSTADEPTHVVTTCNGRRKLGKNYHDYDYQQKLPSDFLENKDGSSEYHQQI